MAKNIVFIGFMGTGKSTIGMRVAERLKKTFVDMDREIESLNGMSVAEIFRRYGEIRFRSEESLMAKKLARQKDLVIATGGGTVLNSENVAVLKENGILVCLDADPADIQVRVNRKKGSRPLLKREASLADIEELLQAREPFYACADIRVTTTGKSMNEIVDVIIASLKMMGYTSNSSARVGPASGGITE